MDFEDVDDVIGVAAELKDASADKLTLEELQEVAGDLDIPAEYVAPAVAELERRRRAKAQAERASRARRNKLLLWAASILGAALVAVLMVQAGLSRALAEVDAHRAHVLNALDRVESTERHYADAPSGDRDARAEIDGAHNRVRVARQRYDEHAAAYNGRAASFPGRFVAPLFDLPTSVPLSAEVTR